MLQVSGLWPNVALFAAAALLIGYIGPKLSRAASRMGEITGLGQTVAGAIFLGAATSLPGIVASLRSAANGQPNLAVGTAIGSIAAQTMFIGLADVALRHTTITAEQKVSDSLMQTAVLIAQLSLILVAMLAASFAFWGVHPTSPIVILGGILGFKAIQGEQKNPHWRATGDGFEQPEKQQQVKQRSGNEPEAKQAGQRKARTENQARSEAEASSQPPRHAEPEHGLLARLAVSVPFEFVRGLSGNGQRQPEPDPGKTWDQQADQAVEHTAKKQQQAEGQQPDETGDEEEESTKKLVGRFALYVVGVFIGGWVINTSANGIMDATGWSPVLVGATLMGIATSFPELVTAISAVRQGNVGLAIGDIVGGNAFDTMVVATSDFFYREGSVYEAVDPNVHLLNALAILMTGILLAGFIRRERRELGEIGVESYLILFTYAAGILVIIFFGGGQ